eukprot:1593213-Rhodomonas_salina.2
MRSVPSPEPTSRTMTCAGASIPADLLVSCPLHCDVLGRYECLSSGLESEVCPRQHPPRAFGWRPARV